MSLFNLFKKETSKPIVEDSTALSISHKDLKAKGPTLHEDLEGLVWIGDGRYKNYTQPSKNSQTINIDNFSFSISMLNNEEPSLIYTSQKIVIPDIIENIERPPYYPTYSTLTPEQKGVYLHLLSNPYDSKINIGFVFILYYGLERHLLHGDYEKAYRTILKLRDVHSNSSFQYYSASALILSAMLHGRGDLVMEFIDSLDKEHEYNFSDNLFLISYYSFDTPIKSDDIIRMSKAFGFTNMNYIKKYPDVFSDILKAILLKKYGTDGILLKNFLSESEIAKIKSSKQRMFANMSIIDEEISVPQFIKCRFLINEMNSLLNEAHNSVKKLLAERRKSGKPIPEKQAPKVPKATLVFDPEQEKSLLEDLEKNQDNLVDRHFVYIYLQDFYYKYRNLDNKYVDKCKEYCYLDINSLIEMFSEYVQKEIAQVNQLKDIYGPEYTQERIEEIRKEGFIGNIPAFNRLAIIYEKEGNIQEAINICKKAIENNQNIKSFEDRINKLESKIG